MERPTSPSKPSGIPRPGGSRLPTLKKQTSHLPAPKPKREEISEPTRPIPRQPTLQKRASTSSFRSSQTAPKDAVATAQAFQRRGHALASKPSLNLKPATQTSKPAPLRPTSRGNRNQQPAPAARPSGTTEDEENNDQLASLDSFRSASRLGSRDGQPASPEEYVEPETIATPKQRKTSRPSLSDRTMESLSSLPTTPRDRRRSSFFSPVESPMGGLMGPPPRPGSSLSRNGSNGNSRPGTSDGSLVKPLERSSSLYKRSPTSSKPATRTSLGGFGFTPEGGSRRSVSAAFSSRLDGPKEAAPSLPTAASPSKTPRPSALSTGRTPSKIGTGSKTIGARPTKPRPALGGVFAKPPKPKPEVDAAPESNPAAVNVPSISKPLLEAKSKTSSPGPSSSAGLRQQIAAAKAAARSAKQKHDSTQNLSATDSSNTYEFDLATDPFNRAPKDPNHILHNRINAARMDGKLNLSAMSLQVIPPEVLKMYNSAVIAESRVNWAEVVDLSRLNIADNDLETLDSEAFPDISTEELMDKDDDEDEQGNQFRGLEVIDAHHNKLHSLPLGLRRLESLTKLDLAHNALENSALEIIGQIHSLKDLKLAHNHLSGNFPPAFCNQLPALESLDVQHNRLLAFPQALRELRSLRNLNVTGNQLTSLPMEALQQLPLTESQAANNALIGSLFPLGCESAHSTLKILNVANNSLAALTFNEEGLELPALQTLNANNNHLATLPAVGAWKNLVTLVAGENKINELPEGFTGLEKLKNVNLQSNEIRVLNPEIARIRGLVGLVVSGNPLRERRYLTLSTEDIKRDLGRKLEHEEDEEELGDQGDHGQFTPNNDVAGVKPKWTLKANHTLDLSSQGLTDETLETTLPAFLAENQARHLLLAHNKLTRIPTTSLESAAPWLQTLDLSHNPLNPSMNNTTTNQTHPLTLPHLTNLTLSSVPLHTLSPLTTTLTLPALQTLSLPRTSLTGPLAPFTTLYPKLINLHAPHNAFTTLKADDIRGCKVVDLSHNALEVLPGEVGLLWFEGLRELGVGGNLFRVPGWRVLERGTEEVCLWLRGRVGEWVEGEEEEGG